MQPLVEHFFRHEFARTVAALTQRFGWRHAESVEDAVQTALVEALQSWKQQGPPPQPQAWIRRVAQNKLIDQLRRQNRQESLDLQAAEQQHDWPLQDETK